MTETKTLPPLPDRLSVDPRSPHHVAAVCEHEIGIRFNGQDRHDVEEYCISEGWIRVPAGRTRYLLTYLDRTDVRRVSEGP